MGTVGFLLYLLSCSSLAIVTVFFLPSQQYSSLIQFSNEDHGTIVWPKLEFNWRIVVMTVGGFLGSAFGTVGGVGGGGIFVPMLNLIVGFDTKSAAALSKCMIMGASASSVWYNLRVLHPNSEKPIIDYDLALLFQPMLMLGITIGVSLSVVFPFWLISVLIIILFLGTSSRSFCKAIAMWREETVLKKEEANCEAMKFHNGEILIGTECEPLLSREERKGMQIILSNIKWKGLLVLLIVWTSFLLLQIIKNRTTTCSTMYWILNILQFPVAIAVFVSEATKLYRENKQRKLNGDPEPVCEASVEWTHLPLCFSAFCGLCGGTVGGLLGSGGGFILGPLLLEFGVIPQVASATATFVMLFSSSLSVLEFYFLKRFPIPYALYLSGVSMLAGFWGQLFVRKMVKVLKRASIIVFILSTVIFASALTMGVIGLVRTMTMIKEHKYIGFQSFCQ